MMSNNNKKFAGTHTCYGASLLQVLKHGEALFDQGENASLISVLAASDTTRVTNIDPFIGPMLDGMEPAVSLGDHVDLGEFFTHLLTKLCIPAQVFPVIKCSGCSSVIEIPFLYAGGDHPPAKCKNCSMFNIGNSVSLHNVFFRIFRDDSGFELSGLVDSYEKHFSGVKYIQCGIILYYRSGMGGHWITIQRCNPSFGVIHDDGRDKKTGNWQELVEGKLIAGFKIIFVYYIRDANSCQPVVSAVEDAPIAPNVSPIVGKAVPGPIPLTLPMPPSLVQDATPLTPTAADFPPLPSPSIFNMPSTFPTDEFPPLVSPSIISPTPNPFFSVELPALLTVLRTPRLKRRYEIRKFFDQRNLIMVHQSDIDRSICTHIGLIGEYLAKKYVPDFNQLRYFANKLGYAVPKTGKSFFSRLYKTDEMVEVIKKFFVKYAPSLAAPTPLISSMEMPPPPSPSMLTGPLTGSLQVPSLPPSPILIMTNNVVKNYSSLDHHLDDNFIDIVKSFKVNKILADFNIPIKGKKAKTVLVKMLLEEAFKQVCLALTASEMETFCSTGIQGMQAMFERSYLNNTIIQQINLMRAKIAERQHDNVTDMEVDAQLPPPDSLMDVNVSVEGNPEVDLMIPQMHANNARFLGSDYMSTHRIESEESFVSVNSIDVKKASLPILWKIIKYDAHISDITEGIVRKAKKVILKRLFEKSKASFMNLQEIFRDLKLGPVPSEPQERSFVRLQHYILDTDNFEQQVSYLNDMVRTNKSCVTSRISSLYYLLDTVQHVNLFRDLTRMFKDEDLSFLDNSLPVPQKNKLILNKFKGDDRIGPIIVKFHDISCRTEMHKLIKNKFVNKSVAEIL